MNKFFRVVRAFVHTYRPFCIGLAGVVGAGAIGTGAYAAYNKFFAEPEVTEKVKEADITAAADVYVPEFQNVFLTSESLEKDLTLYISSDGENCITGVPFQVKLLSPETAESLQSYVDAIADLDAQISEYTAPYVEAGLLTVPEAAPAVEEGSEEEPAEEAEAEEQTSEETAEAEVAGPSQAEQLLDILKDRNVPVEVTDENGEVVEVQPSDIESDPLYQLLLDKETAVQAFAVALNEAEGTVYTDEDMDGVISETDMTPGDYVACIINDLADTEAVKYEPTSYKTEVNVKDKVELKVQKEIIKQVKKDAPSEDGQKEAAIPVEAAPKDTVEFVESRKVEKGGTVKETTDVVPPKGNAKGSKATKKGEGVTKITYTPKAATVKVTVVCKDDAGKEIKREVREVPKGSNQTIAQPAVDGYEFVKVEGTNTFNAIAADQTVSFIYKKAVKTFEVTIKYNGYNGGNTEEKKTVKAGDPIPAKACDGYSVSPANYTVAEGKTVYEFTYTKNAPATVKVTVKGVCDGKEIYNNTVEKKAGEKVSAPTVDGYTCSEGAKSFDANNPVVTFTFTKNKPVETPPANDDNKPSEGGNNSDGSNDSNGSSGGDNQQTTEPSQDNANPPADGGNTTKRNGKNRVAAANSIFDAPTMLNILIAASPAGANVETATLDMTYSNGTFTITCTSNVSKVTVNGAEVKIEKNKGTFKATKDGDYTLAGIATFSDGTQDNRLKVTYTVSGYGQGTEEKLKDSKGNQLYVDAECKKEATAADYEKGRTYYYKEADYTYYGWQTIDGRTFFFDKNGNPVTGTQVIQGVSYNFGNDGAIVSNGTGIDVSKHQGSIDWKQAGPAVSFAIIRCGYRGMYDGQLHEDPYFYTNMKGAKGNGVNTGIYIYSTALNEAEAVAEASMAVAMANKAGGCALPIYIDMEDTTRGQSRLTNEQRTAIVNAFCTTVQSGGHRAGVYASKNWMSGKINTGSLPGSCSIWVAQYNTACSYSGRYNIWQYSSKGSIPGIKGNVDMNKSYF